MKFLIESSSNTITINKYRKRDLVLKPQGVLFIGTDRTSKNLRVPAMRPLSILVYKNQIAEFDEYLYIPEDQVENLYNNMLRDFPKYIAQKELSKFEWADIKKAHPYKGV